MVKITNGSSSKIIHDDRLNLRLSDTKVASTINQAGSFAFDIYPNSPGWGLLNEFTTKIEITKQGKLLFKGRVLSVQKNYTSDGQLLNQVSCESQLAFLNDSVQSYKKVQMTPKAFFTFLIGEHNKQVDADRQFKVGRVDVTNSTNNVYCYIEDGLSTFDEIEADLLNNESLGGELWIRNEDGVAYIDWLCDGNIKGKQQIKLNKNMLSVYSKPDLNGLCTVLYPFGATPEESRTSTDDKASDVASPRLTIESVNGGKKYLEDSWLISKLGRISGSKTWDDVKVAANLKTKGQAYLNTFKSVKIGYELEAVDLQPLGLAADDFEVGKYYQVINQLEGLNDYLRIVAMTVDLNAPLQSQLTLADKSVKLSQYQLENRNAMVEQRKLAQQAKAQATRAYDSRLIGTLVDNIVPVGPQDDGEETMPVFMLQVAEDNPDFGLKKGDSFAVQTTADGIIGLDRKIDGKIKSKAEKTDLDKLNDKVDNIQIGGRNLLLDSTNQRNTDYWQTTNPNKDIKKYYNGSNVIAKSGAWSNIRYRLSNLAERGVVNTTDYFTFSMLVKGDADFEAVSNTAIRFYCSVSNTNPDVVKDVSTFISKTEWKKISVTFKFKSLETTSSNEYDESIRFELLKNLTKGNVLFTQPTLVRGTKVTDWTPAPEDVDDKIKKLEKQIEGPVDNVQIKDAVTGSIYLLTVSNGEIKLEKGADNSDG